MKKARIICIEGTEGVGKTTQTELLASYLTKNGFSVLKTKEPGTSHIPLTMLLRQIMLDNQYDEILTRQARELISQAIRSIHIEKLIEPAKEQYDFIIQDRGALSGFSYGTACGNSFYDLMVLSRYALNCKEPFKLYDDIVLLKGNVSKGLSRALNSKKEFLTGDAMENKGDSFIKRASNNMSEYGLLFENCHVVQVDNKNMYAVFDEILASLRINCNGQSKSNNQ
jgi:dTMP kinase